MAKLIHKNFYGIRAFRPITLTAASPDIASSNLNASLHIANTTNFVSIKFDGNNYLLWCDKPESILISTELIYSFVDWSISTSSKNYIL